MVDGERVQQIKNTIRRHLETVGATRWKVVQSQYPGISEATFWRYVKAVREEIAVAEAPLPSAGSAHEDIIDSTPPLGSLPAYYNPLKKGRQYESLVADAEAMKAQALDHRGRITDRIMYERSILVREKLMREQQQVMAFFQSEEVNQQYHDCLVEVIAAEAPEVHRKLMEKLQSLQEKRLGLQG